MQERERFRVGLERTNDYSGRQKGRYAVGWDTDHKDLDAVLFTLMLLGSLSMT